jgi:hypothetical protein
MRIKKMSVCTAADTTKQEYVVKVKALLAQHDHQGCQPYLQRAKELFKNDPDSETLLPILLSD